MTRHGTTRHTPLDESGDVAGEASTGRVPDELSLVLAQAAVSAIESAGGYAGGVYLRSSTPGLLRLAVLAGLPGPLFRPWWRMQVKRPFPVSESYRTGRAVLLADAEEAMRRFPQLMAGLPFPFGSLYLPVGAGRDRAGVLFVMRAATPGEPVAPAESGRLQRIARRLGQDLAELGSGGTSCLWDEAPLPVQLPAAIAPPLRIGRFDWELESGAVTADEEMCAILGTTPAAFPGTVDALAARLVPEDVYGLWALARQAVEPDASVVRRMRLRGPDGRSHLLELSGRGVHPTGDGAASHLTGFVVDLGAGPVVAEAAERIPAASSRSTGSAGSPTPTTWPRTSSAAAGPSWSGASCGRPCRGSGTPPTRTTTGPRCSRTRPSTSWPAAPRMNGSPSPCTPATTG